MMAPKKIISKYSRVKIILSSVEPIILKSSSEKFKPNKVTKIEITIANTIDWATYIEAFLSSFAPIELLIRAVVPAPIPTATAIAMKYIGHDFAIAANASGEILPAK